MSAADTAQLAFKTAIRQQDEWVIAYIANLDGSDKTEIGRVLASTLDGRDGPLFQRWKTLMHDMTIRIIRDATGADVSSDGIDYDPADLEMEPEA